MNIYVTAFNQMQWLAPMCDNLADNGHKITIVDNNSTNPKLKDWYQQTKHRVIELPYNGGNIVCWTLLGQDLDNNDYFVITDCDLDVTAIPDNWTDLLIKGVDLYAGEGGCGAALDCTMIPSQNPAWRLDEFYKYPAGDHPTIAAPELQLGAGYVNFPVDTTFAVYPPGTTQFRLSNTGVRCNHVMMRHLPWHVVLDLDPTEASYQILYNDDYHQYLQTIIDAGKALMTGTTPRMYEFMQEYARRNNL